MNDSVVELLIKRKVTVATLAIWFGLTIVSLISVFFSIMASIFWPFTVVILMIVYFIYKKTNIEYEYTMINENIVIDKIMNKQKRKRVINFDIRKFDVVAPAGHQELSRYKNMKVLNCSSDDRTHNIFIGILKSEDKVIRLIFEPNDRMLETMRIIIGKKLYMN
ncbi:MAG: hypothetical protein K0R15_2839 [Clostridiales bacterium]|jgi:hypothetical protein|nr:hypothetical protein [Clostridiales bacterium]